MAKASRNDSQGGGENTALRGFVSKISRYFLDFLQTDFKVQRAPRRRIQFKTEAGFRAGMPLRKYDTLINAVWEVLAKPAGDKPVIRIPRGRYKAQISTVMRDFLRKTVNNIDPDAFKKVRLTTLASVTDTKGKAKKDPEAYIEGVKTDFSEAVNLAVVTPLLATLEGEFEKSAYSIMESVFSAQTDILAALTVPVLEQLPTAINTYLVKDSTKEIESVLNDEFDEKDAKKRLRDYFEDMVAVDAYQELRDITNYARMGGQDLQIYLYVCDIKYGHNAYPVFYIPATITFDDKTGDMLFALDPHLYAHKHAIDFVQQETKGAANLALSPIDNRILYLDETSKFLDEMHRILVRMFTQFDLRGEFDIKTVNAEAKESAEIVIAKSAYIAAYDKNDQSVVNDYEQLIAALDENDQEVMTLFHDMVSAILMDNPIDISSEVEDAWAQEQTYIKLVARSPIPLNEEQRRVLIAKNDPRCRFITLQGPPGTGKSHTITAIAFDAIERGESCLILSDKNEALDVVEDKLSDVLAVARDGDEDFPNPILRIGRVGGTYNRLISPSALTKITAYHAAVHSHIENIKKEVKKQENTLKTEVEKTIESFTSASAQDIQLLLELEQLLSAHAPGYVEHLRGAISDYNKLEIKIALDVWDANPGCMESLEENTAPMSLEEARLLTLSYRLASRKRDYWEYHEILSLFDGLSAANLNDLRAIINDYKTARLPIFGYLFSGAKLRELAQRAVKDLGCRNPVDIHNLQTALRLAEKLVDELYAITDHDRSFDNVCANAYRLLSSSKPLPGKEVEALGMMLNRLQRAMTHNKKLTATLKTGTRKLPDLRSLLALAERSVRYMHLYYQMHHVMANPPKLDFQKSKSKIESHYTTLMTHNLDSRFINFMRENKADAKDIGGIIRGKKKFPVEKFPKVKKAFPIIIAGIREFAEYVPLRKEAFDIVVIDEASQVSVAQALPAILRAKTVIVLGDKRQFSNVKSMQASIAHNNNYLTDIRTYFTRNIKDSQDKLERLAAFDVKKSVLEFFDLCSNYSSMLRKHFRGYQELISFSSEMFYDNQLQAIKIRGKPIEEVLRFTQVTPVAEEFKNTNKAEADYILGHLRELIAQEKPPTVGIITPHREQQKYLTNLIMRDPDASQFEALLRLKIMTFDTCQGEERDLILYSMVATKEHDVLNFVFPVSLDAAVDKIDHQLKMQRLNVGFSRAKECMHFVLSKPIPEYGGTVLRVLSHYQKILTDKSAPEPGDTDPASPMETFVLEWIKQSTFYRKNHDCIDLKAQFPVGEYLRQLDHTYHHPNWRVDFLLVYRHNSHDTKIIIEYDGFAEHFTDREKVHEGNYESFYKPQDIERQLVIESYGYKFLRLNRFNLGENPVEAISSRLNQLANGDQEAQRSESQERVKKAIKDIEEGDSKPCPRCNIVKRLEDFYDGRLKGGKGGIGSVCRKCKGMREL